MNYTPEIQRGSPGNDGETNLQTSKGPVSGFQPFVLGGVFAGWLTVKHT